ncbi:hypothetical protein Tco_0030466 [Tanacetum coccineum]
MESEVILNGDSPLPTRTVNGFETSVSPTTAEQKLARKNELKARGTGMDMSQKGKNEVKRTKLSMGMKRA